MRKSLKKYQETRAKFTGVFVRKGVKNGWHSTIETVMLMEIKDINGELLCDSFVVQFHERLSSTREAEWRRSYSILCPM